MVLLERDGYKYEVRLDKTYHRVCSPTKEGRWVAPRFVKDIFIKPSSKFKQNIDEYLKDI